MHIIQHQNNEDSTFPHKIGFFVASNIYTAVTLCMDTNVTKFWQSWDFLPEKIAGDVVSDSLTV